MTVTFNPNPNFKQDAMAAFEKKIQSILSIRCDEHNKTPRLANVGGKPSFETCCEKLETRVREAMGK
jgi:hypothetical protein